MTVIDSFPASAWLRCLSRRRDQRGFASIMAIGLCLLLSATVLAVAIAAANSETTTRKGRQNVQARQLAETALGAALYNFNTGAQDPAQGPTSLSGDAANGASGSWKYSTDPDSHEITVTGIVDSIHGDPTRISYTYPLRSRTVASTDKDDDGNVLNGVATAGSRGEAGKAPGLWSVPLSSAEDSTFNGSVRGADGVSPGEWDVYGGTAHTTDPDLVFSGFGDEARSSDAERLSRSQLNGFLDRNYFHAMREWSQDHPLKCLLSALPLSVYGGDFDCVNGNWNLTTQLVRKSSGTVTIYVRGTLTLNALTSLIGSSDGAQLHIYAGGGVDITSSLNLNNVFIYSAGTCKTTGSTTTVTLTHSAIACRVIDMPNTGNTITGSPNPAPEPAWDGSDGPVLPETQTVYYTEQTGFVDRLSP